MAGTDTWNGGTGDWSDGADWSPGAPGALDAAVFNSPSNVTVSASDDEQIASCR